MKIVVTDITGRTLNYDYALCDSICELLKANDSIEFWGPRKEHSDKLKVRSFGSVVPNKYKTSDKSLVRVLKAFDTIIAYMRIIIIVFRLKPDVFHLQWFPFLSLGVRGAAIDVFFLKLIKKASKKTRLVFTIHNMCPHGMSEKDRGGYNPIFSNALKAFDHFIVHTEKTKEEVLDLFGLKANQVTLVYHGVFTPKGVTFKQKEWDKNHIKLIMYGAQNWYKGTDVFIEALKYLPVEVKKRISVSVCGVIDQETDNKCKAINTDCDIEWMSYYLDDNQLYDKIKESDIILLPYRRISQSGVLLLAIGTKRHIITSDLPTFRETLKGYNEDMFFESDNAKSLAALICRYVNDEINREQALKSLDALSKLYSWEESAKSTINIYNTITQ